MRAPPSAACPRLFEDILVPKERVTEVRRGRKIDTERKFFPGYVLVKMDMTDRGLSPDQEHPEGHRLPRRRQEAYADPGSRGDAHRPAGPGGCRSPQDDDLLRGRREGARQRRSLRLLRRLQSRRSTTAAPASRSPFRSSAGRRRWNWNSVRSTSSDPICRRPSGRRHEPDAFGHPAEARFAAPPSPVGGEGRRFAILPEPDHETQPTVRSGRVRRTSWRRKSSDYIKLQVPAGRG